MEDYDLDLPADVVVGWIVLAADKGGAGMQINAWREYVQDESFIAEKGGYEETGVSEVTAVGSLEVMPEHLSDSWILRVRVVDELGDRLPVDEDAPEGPEEISLDQFCSEFIAPERGTASIQVSATGPAEKTEFDRFLTALEHDAMAAEAKAG